MDEGKRCTRGWQADRFFVLLADEGSDGPMVAHIIGYRQQISTNNVHPVLLKKNAHLGPHLLCSPSEGVWPLGISFSRRRILQAPLRVKGCVAKGEQMNRTIEASEQTWIRLKIRGALEMKKINWLIQRQFERKYKEQNVTCWSKQSLKLRICRGDFFDRRLGYGHSRFQTPVLIFDKLCIETSNQLSSKQTRWQRHLETCIEVSLGCFRYISVKNVVVRLGLLDRINLAQESNI